MAKKDKEKMLFAGIRKGILTEFAKRLRFIRTDISSI